jgi:hypothetical protein
VMKAQLRRIELAKKKGELVDRAHATALIFRLARQERDGLAGQRGLRRSYRPRSGSARMPCRWFSRSYGGPPQYHARTAVSSAYARVGGVARGDGRRACTAVYSAPPATYPLGEKSLVWRDGLVRSRHLCPQGTARYGEGGAAGEETVMDYSLGAGRLFALCLHTLDRQRNDEPLPEDPAGVFARLEGRPAATRPRHCDACLAYFETCVTSARRRC